MENQHIREELADWEQIHSPFSTITAELIDNNNNDNPIVVTDNFFSESSVFPPGNHEDLPISNDNQHSQEQEPISLLLPSSDGGDDGVIRRWIRLRLEDMRAGIFRFADSIGKCIVFNGAFRSFAWTGGGVAAVLLVLVLYRRVLLWWRRRVQIESRKESLMSLIKEKDERINQLLLQIAKMNEILLARRRVPVIRVK